MLVMLNNDQRCKEWYNRTEEWSGKVNFSSSGAVGMSNKFAMALTTISFSVFGI